jgi:molecular chaperone DnaK
LHADEDKQKKELADVRNQADQLCYQLEKQIKENAEKLRDSDKEPLTQAIERTREVAKGSDVAAIKSAVESLEQAANAFSKILYERGAAAGGEGGEAPQAGPAQSSGGDDAIDAEFEVKDK